MPENNGSAVGSHTTIANLKVSLSDQKNVLLQRIEDTKKGVMDTWKEIAGKNSTVIPEALTVEKLIGQHDQPYQRPNITFTITPEMSEIFGTYHKNDKEKHDKAVNDHKKMAKKKPLLFIVISIILLSLSSFILNNIDLWQISEDYYQSNLSTMIDKVNSDTGIDKTKVIVVLEDAKSRNMPTPKEVHTITNHPLYEKYRTYMNGYYDHLNFYQWVILTILFAGPIALYTLYVMTIGRANRKRKVKAFKKKITAELQKTINAHNDWSENVVSSYLNAIEPMMQRAKFNQNAYVRIEWLLHAASLKDDNEVINASAHDDIPIIYNAFMEKFPNIWDELSAQQSAE